MKSYLYLAFFFMVMTYLTPKEQYRRYFRFMLGVFLAVIILKPLAAGYEYDMRFAELTKKIEGISYEYDADTTDLFTAFEAEENRLHSDFTCWSTASYCGASGKRG